MNDRWSDRLVRALPMALGVGLMGGALWAFVRFYPVLLRGLE
jgi:hypothetical protein